MAPKARHRRRAVLGLAASAGAGVALSALAASGGFILARRWGLLVVIAAWSVAWAAGVASALRLPPRVAVPAVLAAAAAVRLAALAGPPTLSDDLFRYAWDARVQAAGVNPYAHPPSSPSLSTLREPWLWPDERGCEQLGRAPGCTRINRPGEPTIYPPGAQAWFRAVHGSSGGADRHKPWQVAGLALDLVVVALLPALLRAWGNDERWTALYGLSPLPALEAVNNGHVDGVAVLLVALALGLAARRRAGWAGAALGGAVVVKLYPAVLVLALVSAARSGRDWLLRSVAAAAAVLAAGYLPHVLTVGERVLGYLPGYLREEDYIGGRYLLAGLLNLPGPVTAAVAAAAVAAVGLWVVIRQPPAPRACAALLGTLLLAATPVQPWYGMVLLLVATVAASPRWAVVAAAAYPLFFAVLLDAPHAGAIGRLAYGCALAAVVVGAVRRAPAGSEGKAAGAGRRPAKAAVQPPQPPGGDEKEDGEGDVLVGLLEQPTVGRGVQQGQADLLGEADEGRAAARQAEHQQEADPHFGGRDHPLHQVEVVEQEAGDGLDARHLAARPAARRVLQPLVAEDEAHGVAVDEVGGEGPEGDAGDPDELGHAVGQEDDSHEDAQRRQPLGQPPGGG